MKALLLSLVALLAAPSLRAAAPPDDLEPLLDRAGQYVASYTQAFKDILATEDYRQTLRTGGLGRPYLRVTRADILVVAIEGPIPWVTFRDVYEADGQPVRNREERLRRLLGEGQAAALARGPAILEESARYNLGPLHRTLNVPTLALLFVRSENRPRFAFARAGRKRIGDVETVEVRFEERTRPGLVHDDAGNDVPCEGRLWIEPGTGAIVRTEVGYRQAARGESAPASSARVTTDFEPDAKLGLRVPVSMQEHYEIGDAFTGRPKQQPRMDTPVSSDGLVAAGVIRIEATARYSSYRRFEVQTEEYFDAVPERPNQ